MANIKVCYLSYRQGGWQDRVTGWGWERVVVGVTILAHWWFPGQFLTQILIFWTIWSKFSSVVISELSFCILPFLPQIRSGQNHQKQCDFGQFCMLGGGLTTVEANPTDHGAFSYCRCISQISLLCTFFSYQKWHSYILKQLGPNMAELDRLRCMCMAIAVEPY